MVNSVKITQEMVNLAKVMAAAREHNMKDKHLFKPPNPQVMVIGFLGEICAMEWADINWRDKQNWHTKYDGTADDCDLVFMGKKVDVKTQSAFRTYAEKILAGVDLDYRLLVATKQTRRLRGYDYVLFGLIEKAKLSAVIVGYKCWYALGYMRACDILENYVATNSHPNGKPYLTENYAIRLNELIPPENFYFLENN